MRIEIRHALEARLDPTIELPLLCCCRKVNSRRMLAPSRVPVSCIFYLYTCMCVGIHTHRYAPESDKFNSTGNWYLVKTGQEYILRRRGRKKMYSSHKSRIMEESPDWTSEKIQRNTVKLNWQCNNIFKKCEDSIWIFSFFFFNTCFEEYSSHDEINLLAEKKDRRSVIKNSWTPWHACSVC